MHNSTTKVTLCLSLLVFGARLLAQAPAEMTLDDALRLANQNSLKLGVSQNELRKANLARSELRASGLPQLTVKAGASYAPDQRNFGYDPAVTDGGQLNGQIGLEQSLYDGGARRLKTEQLALDFEKLRTEQHLMERDLVAEVKQRFIELLQAKLRFALQQESVSQLQSYFDLVRSMNRGGGVPYTDVLKTQVDLANAEVALEKAHNSKLSAIYALELATGLTVDTSLTVRGTLDSLSFGNADSLLSVPPTDPAHAIELYSANLDVHRSELDVQIARRERRPLIDLTADAGYLSSRDNLTVPANERYGGLGFSAGVNAALPLFNGGATRMRIQQAELEANALRIQRQLLERSLTSQMQSLRLQIQSETQTLNNLRQTIDTAEQNYLLMRSTYAGGGTTATEVLSAQEMLRDAKLSELESLAAIAQLKVQLEQASTPYTGAQP